MLSACGEMSPAKGDPDESVAAAEQTATTQDGRAAEDAAISNALEIDPWATTEEEFEEKTEDGRIIAPVGSDIAQIVAFYNRRANAVKAARQITVKKHDFRDGDMQVPAVLKNLTNIESFDPDLDKTTKELFVNGIGTKRPTRKLNNFMPVNGTPYLSRLQSSYVTKATCELQEDGWLIWIYLKDETLTLDTLRKNAGGIKNISEVDQNVLINGVLLKTMYGSCMDLGFSDLFLGGTDSSPRIKFDLRMVNGAANLSEGKIAAVVDFDGNLTSLGLAYKNNINITYMTMNIKINGLAKQSYRFTWPEKATDG